MTTEQNHAVTLRPISEHDLPIFFTHQQDPEAVHMAAFTADDPSDLPAFMAHWARIMSDPSVHMRTILVNGLVAGHVASYIDTEFNKREVTYWIGREYWGKGITTLALSSYLAEITARPIYGRAAADNTASIRIMQKCGFKFIGSEKGFANARGHEIDEVILELT